MLEFYNKGMVQAEMAEALGVDQSTVSRDIRTLSKEARKDMSEFFSKRVHLECARLMTGVDGAIKMV